MFDWQVNSEDSQEQPLTHDVREERASRDIRRWRLSGGLLLLLMVAGLFVFRWRLTERTELMESDLKAFIRHEQQQRAFGLTEEADELMVPNAPEVWQGVYRSTFVAEADEVQPVELEVEEIELKGSTAYVTVRLDDVAEVRFYRLVGQEWRRAPLSKEVWGEERQIELAEAGITIIYRARDEAFVEKLAHDLPTLLEQSPAEKMPARIRIEPTEFALTSLFVSESGPTHQIVLNSPKLTMREYADIDREATVRLALADALLEEANLDYQTQQSALPGAPTFLSALRNTFILRWALPDEAIPRLIWREKVEGLWKSPFLGQWKINREEVLLERTWEPRLSEATALLMADYLYDVIGPEELQHVIKQLPTAASWDRIFYPRTRRYTTALEYEMRLGKPPKMTAHNINALPLSVTVLDTDAESGQLEVEVTGQGRQLSIKTAESTLSASRKIMSELPSTGSGENFNAGCAMLHKEVSIIEGDWLEVGKTLLARQLSLTEPEPVILPKETTLAPPDTLAYLAQQSVENRLRGSGFNSFLALSEDGSTTDLMTLPALMSASVHAQSNLPWPPRFLMTLNVPNCEQAWLFMYDPQQGVIDRWLASFPGAFSGSPLDSFSGPSVLPGFVWRPQEGDFLLTEPIRYGISSSLSQKNQYWSASPGKPLRLLGEVENLPHVLGWLGQRVVALDEERKNVNIIDLKMGKITKSIELASPNLRFFMLSEDGKYLFYSYTLPPAEKSIVHVANLESGEDKFLFSGSDGEWLHPATGGISTDRLLLLVTQQENGAHIPTQLLRVDLNAASQPTLVMEIPFMQYVTSALVCENDSVLMTIHEEGVTEVRMWKPDGSTKSLFRTDKELSLLSCR